MGRRAKVGVMSGDNILLTNDEEGLLPEGEWHQGNTGCIGGSSFVTASGGEKRALGPGAAAEIAAGLQKKRVVSAS